MLGRLRFFRRLSAIEARLQAVEQRLRINVGIAKAEDRPVCPKCGIGRLTITAERPHPFLGQAGVTTNTLKCDTATCGHVVVDPG